MSSSSVQSDDTFLNVKTTGNTPEEEHHREGIYKAPRCRGPMTGEYASKSHSVTLVRVKMPRLDAFSCIGELTLTIGARERQKQGIFMQYFYLFIF